MINIDEGFILNQGGLLHHSVKVVHLIIDPIVAHKDEAALIVSVLLPCGGLGSAYIKHVVGLSRGLHNTSVGVIPSILS